MNTLQDVIDYLSEGLSPNVMYELPSTKYENKIYRACEMLQEIADRDRWIPVGERLPEEENDYLVADKWGYVFEANYEKALSGFVYVNPDGDRLADKTVTHWREMPAPQKKQP